MNDAVTFRSDRFSLQPPVENGRSYDLPLGDDLAAFIAGRIRVLRPDVKVRDPIREDWGTVLVICVQGQLYDLNIHWVPDAKLENRWGIQFAQPVGCLGFVLGRRSRPEKCRTAQQLVAEILAADPQTFVDPEWLSQSEYLRRM